MSERLEPILRKVCLILAVVLVVRVGYALFRPSPLANLHIPELPTLASDNTNAAPVLAKAGPASPTTNPVVVTAGGTNTPASNKADSAANKPVTTAPAGTNAIVSTNAPVGTNVVAGTNSVVAKTNAVAATPAGPPGMPPGMFPGMPPGMMMPGIGRGGPGKPPASLPPLAQARLDRVIQSEILGPVQRPLPMALLGIAGTNVFLRGTNGQTAMIGEGGDVGGLKLLRIGTNRVLVEDAGTKKELTIFNGEGGTSLLPK